MKCLSPVIIYKCQKTFVFYLPKFIRRFLYVHFGVKGTFKTKRYKSFPCGCCSNCVSAFKFDYFVSQPRSVFNLHCI